MAHREMKFKNVGQSSYEMFMGYAAVMALLGVVAIGLGVATMLWGSNPERMFIGDASIHVAWTFLFGIPTLLAHGTALALGKSKAGWVFDMILIGLGIFTVILAPLLIPLMGRWVQPEVKALFHRADQSPEPVIRTLPHARYDRG